MIYKNVKYLIVGAITGLLLSSILPIFASVGMNKIDVLYNDIKIQINGKLIDTQGDNPFLFNGRTYIPARYVAQELGATVKWNETSGVVEIDQNTVLKSIEDSIPVLTPIDTSSFKILNKPSPTPTPTPVPIQFHNEITINDNCVEVDMISILNDELLMPPRPVVKELGIVGTWIGDKKQMIFKKDSNILVMTLDNDKYLFNNVEYTMKIAPRTINGKTMIPIRYVIENFGGNLNIDLVSRVITINSK